ncbi:MAG: CBS domain-containing protein [Sulfuricellaceae bacterium]|nr:CBS domain-containing protein [Sulfuricellaceae bacterium]
MFSIHGVTGQTFRGTLEQMALVRDVLPTRHARGIAREGDELGAEFRVFRQHSGGESEKEDAHYAHAAAAYAQMLHREVKRDPVRHAWQVMSREVLTLHMRDTVQTAWTALVARRVRQAPVLNAARRVVGVVCDRDLLTVIDLHGGQIIGGLERIVAEVMTTPVVCADPVTDIRRIVHVLLDSGLTAVPVLDESGELVGIVSRGDILRAAMTDPPLSLWA